MRNKTEPHLHEVGFRNSFLSINSTGTPSLCRLASVGC